MQQDYITTIRSLIVGLPGMEEGTAYGTVAFRIKGKLFARLLEDGITLALKMDFETRDFLMQMQPEVFRITDHYRNYQYVLVNLPFIEPEELRGHFVQSWRNFAPKRLRAEYDRLTEA